MGGVYYSPKTILELCCFSIKTIETNSKIKYLELVLCNNLTYCVLTLNIFLSHHCSPVESSRFGSSGNLSQTSSQLSETGQESTGGSEHEESFHSYHSTSIHPSTNGQPRTNGHPPTNGHSTVGEQELHRLSPAVGRDLKNDTQAERGSSKLQR